MTDFATLFAIIVASLRAAVANHSARERTRTTILVLAWYRIGRAAQRFQTLFARWQSNTLPTPRPSRAGKPRAARAKTYFPTGRAWLAANRHDICGNASQLQHLFAHPDLPAFLVAAPQAGRILRPLCHMLGIDPPPGATLPPHPPRPRKPRPAPAPPPAPDPNATPDRPIQPWVLAAARYWRKKSA